jgi:ABC-type nitrate/sulfonate/bicarbonate transport system permease component
VPVGVLQSGGLTFEPPLPAPNAAALRRLTMNAFEKVFLRFPTKFWDDGVYAIRQQGPEGGWWHSWYDLTPLHGTPTLLTFAAGPAAREIRDWTEERVVASVLALVMQRWRLAEWGILPWIVVSQTVPLVAFAPLIASLGRQASQGGLPWPEWMSVAVVASYLAFFPMTVGILRGLAAPDRIHLELLRSYGAGYFTTLRKLRLPAAVPYLLPALRLGAANSVVGAIVAEVSINMEGGIGRMIIGLASQGSSDPAKPWSPIFGAVVLGLVAAGSVALLGLALRRYRRGEVPA